MGRGGVEPSGGGGNTAAGDGGAPRVAGARADGGLRAPDRAPAAPRVRRWIRIWSITDACVAGDTLLVDDELERGPRVWHAGEQLIFGGDTLSAVARPPMPPDPPAPWRGLIGEYGWDHNTLFILERDGKLNALIEWFAMYPLR